MKRDEETVGDTATMDSANAPSVAHAAAPPVDELPVVAAETYELGQEVARGGIGRIRRAFDKRMGRFVAIKELLPRHAPNPDTAARFVREALVTGRLEHPSIVPVHEAGRWPSGAPFYAMKLVSGRSLLEVIRDTPRFGDRLALLPTAIAVAEAIAYAHSKRVIHRDIKPANVIVGRFGETVVIDWGLAKDLDAAAVEPAADDGDTEEEHLTERRPPERVGDEARSSMSSPGATIVGKVMGTPAYMPPEQAKGETVDERADVYALGALLYHVLAGCSPFAQDGLTEDETQTASKTGGRTVVPLERRQADIPRELLTIVRKAMARDRAARYPSAQELAEDLKRFQAGQLVSAHDYTPWALARRWLRRYRTYLWLGGAAVVALGVLAAVSVSRIIDEREVAQAQRVEAQRRGAEAEARKNQLILLQATAALDTDPTASLAWLKLYPAAAPAWDRARAIAIDALSRGVAHDVLRGHRGSIQALAVSPDGALVASGATDKTVRLWRPGEGVQVIEVPGAVGNIVFAPGGRELVVTVDRALMVWTLPAGGGAPVQRTLGTHEAAIAGVDVAADGQTIATVSMDRTVRLWPIGGGAPTVWRGETYASWGVAFTPDGRTLVTSSEERNVRIWDVATGTSRTVTNPEPFGPIRVSPDGKTIALAGGTGVHLWSLASEPPAYRALPRQSDYVINLAFSPDGAQLATANSGGSVGLWDMESQKVRTLHGHQGHVVSVQFTRDGRLLATGGDDAGVRLWSTGDLGDGGKTLHGLDRATSHPRFTPDGAQVVVGSAAGLAFWDLDGGFRLRRNAAGAGAVGALTYLADGRIATLGEDGVRMWDARGDAPGKLIASPPAAADLLAVSAAGDLVVLGSGHDAAIILDERGAERCRFPAQDMWSAVFSPDGTELAFVDRDQIRLGTIAGCSARTLYRHAPGIISLAFSPDGRYLASGVDARVMLWDRATDQARPLDGHTQLVTELAFSPDGAFLATGGVDQTVRVWNIPAGTTHRVLAGHEQAIRSLHFLGAGTSLASAALDGTVRVWSLTTDDVRVLRGQEDAISGLAASPDGRHVVSTSRDVTRLWSLDAATLPASTRTPAGLAAWLAATTTATIGAGDVLGSP